MEKENKNLKCSVSKTFKMLKYAMMSNDSSLCSIYLI